MNYRNVAIWGIGNCMRNYYEQIKGDVNIVCFIDRDTEKQNKYFEDNIICISDSDISKWKIDLVLIAVYSNAEVQKIKKYLDCLNIESKHIVDMVMDLNYQKEDEFLRSIHYYEKPIYKIKETEKLAKVICLNLPTKVCNFRCEYCYMLQHGSDVFLNGNRKLLHKPEYMAYAMRRERLQGTCFVDMCASGETLLVDGITDLVYAVIKEGHVIRIVTNGVLTSEIEKMLSLPEDLVENIWFNFSMHYRELVKRDMVDIFFDNIRLIKKSKASLSVTMVGSDIYLEDMDYIIELFEKNVGFLPQIDVARDDKDTKHSKLNSKYSWEEYVNVWGKFESSKFEHRIMYFNRKIEGKCMAGVRYFYCDAFSGNLYPCVQEPYCISNLYKNMDTDISAEKCIEHCTSDWCINSIYVAPFGISLNEKDEMGQAERYNRIDSDGQNMMKPKIMWLLNQKFEEDYKCN